MTDIRKSKEKAEKCKHEIEKMLNKYNCGMTSTPAFKIDKSGYLKVTSEVKVVPLIKVKKKVRESRYMN